MAENTETPTAGSDIETTTVLAVVSLTVAPRTGQSLEDARQQMFKLFNEYITNEEGVFQGDYGATAEQIAAFRENPDEAGEPTWGGWQGPFVLKAVVESFISEAGPVVGLVPPDNDAAWYREMGNTYALIAATPQLGAAAKEANAAEASKYFGIAERLESAALRHS